MRVVVTGAAGFIGSNFVRFWARRHPGDEVVALDALTYAGNRASLADVEGEGSSSTASVRFLQADVRDAEAMASALAGCDLVVHFAAESHNSLAVVDPGRFFSTNVMGTQTLLEAARHAGVGRFHHISTCEVYGDLDLDSPERFAEATPYRPRTPYNASKAGADHAVRAYHLTYGLPVTITNCANNYGPYQFPEKVIPLFVTRALDGQELPLYRSTENRREWIHVLDHCRAIEAVVERGRVGETYHVGTGREASIAELADRVLELTGRPASLKRLVPDRPGHDRRYVLDWEKIRRELGWEPEVPFEEGLAETVAWYRDHREWWEPLVGRSPVDEAAWSASRP